LTHLEWRTSADKKPKNPNTICWQTESKEQGLVTHRIKLEGKMNRKPEGEQNIRESDFRAHKFHVRKHEKKPNILLLMTDQQRFDTIHAAGFEFMHTPNMDRIAAQGCLYTHAFTPIPICLPARHNLITGLTPRHHGFPDNVHTDITRTDLPTLPYILSSHGYDTHSIGKMHFRPARRHNGFLKMELMEELPKTREEDEYATYLKVVGLGNIQNIHGIRNLLYMLPQRSLIPEEHHGTKWVADRAVDYLRSNRGRQPFFLKASWIAPHPPFDLTDRFADLYKDADLPEPYYSQTPLAALTQENAMLGDIPNLAVLRRMRELYYAAISMVDEQIGRVLDTLEDIGQLDNTLVIFLSDHGELLGDYGLFQKWNPYDCCCRIPFLVRYPKQILPGSICDNFVDLNDILPTVLDVTELQYPAEFPLPGESLFAEPQLKDRSWQYVEYGKDNRRWISIRNKAFKYNFYYGGGFEQLFNMQNDPHETTNLLHEYSSPAVAATKREMKKKLIEMERKYGLEGYVGVEDFIVGSPYKPYPQRNEAFPRFPIQIMDEKEKSLMNDNIDEIAWAVAKETVVNLHDLDLSSWQENLHISDEQVLRLLKTVEELRKVE
jgi:arylsulfatase